LQNGLADQGDLKELQQWGTIMKATSRCGLGKTATNSIVQALDKFQDYFQARFTQQGGSAYRNFDLDAAVADYERYKP